MGSVVETEIAGRLPKVLQQMLDVLVASNTLRSWQIYNDNMGISVRLRFDGGNADRGDMQGNVMIGSQPTTTHVQTTAYCKKSPSHIRRDTQRKILKAKRQRLDEVEIETERQDDANQVHFEHDIDSPNMVCDPPSDDTLTLSPLLPISIDFEEETYAYACDIDERRIMVEPEKIIENEIKIGETGSQNVANSDVKCPNCGEIFEWNHICEILDESVDAAEKGNDNDTEKMNIDDDIDLKVERFAKSMKAIFESENFKFGEIWSLKPP